jgi:hypothetical protein
MAQDKKDWEVNPQNYLTNPDGSFIIKKDGTPRKKGGRPKGVGNKLPDSLTLQKKLTKKLKTKQDNVQKLKRKLTRAEKSLTEQKKILTENVLTESEAEKLPDIVQEHLDKTGSHVAFMPNEGPQTDFLAAPEKDVLYGGAAGGGKSFAMLIDPLRYCHKKAHRALILRRTMPELRELIDKSREIYPKAFHGAKFKEVEKVWYFPSGAKVEFGFLEKESDVYRYQGQAYSWIGFDEITHLPTASRLRTTDPEIETNLRCTANPRGTGANWAKKRYVEAADENTTFIGTDGLSRKFIPAKLSDNPFLAEDGKYEQMLMSLPATQRKQLLEGNWDVAEGAAFTEFDVSLHVIPPFEIPVWWERVKAIDYGYSSESCCLWGVVDPEDKTLLIYRELYQKGLTGEALAERIHEMEEYETRSIPGILDTAAWARTGYTGPTIGEMLIKAGHKLRRADKNRVAGKVQIHEYLKTTPSGRPRLQIFNNCVNLVRELQSLPLSKSNPEDVDTHASDHAYDALRYMIMSRPKLENPFERMARIKSTTRFDPADSTFGY